MPLVVFFERLPVSVTQYNLSTSPIKFYIRAEFEWFYPSEYFASWHERNNHGYEFNYCSF